MHREPDGDDAAFLLQGISWGEHNETQSKHLEAGCRSSQIGYPMHKAAYLSIA